jgi:anti-sigma regulatory factor (Ser/Thr protein kinase)
MAPGRFEKSWPPAAPARWSLTLPGDLAAVRTARASVDGWLGDAPRDVRDAARSVVTELVSNAVRHGRAPIQLRVERRAHGWHIDVADAGALRPRRGPAGPQGGWGLTIVEALADRWGVAENASRVWCELDAEHPAVGPRGGAG